MDQPLKNKISHFCDVERKLLLTHLMCTQFIEKYLILNQEHVGRVYLINRIKLETGKQDLEEWKKVVNALQQDEYQVNVGIIGKYVELEDAYRHQRISKTCCRSCRIKVNIEWIQAENKINEEKISHLDSILIPGGFGEARHIWKT